MLCQSLRKSRIIRSAFSLNGTLSQRFSSLEGYQKGKGDITSHSKQHIAVAVSGGVDSSVAAYLLKQQGHEVTGIFMQNWDEAEELGNANCSVQQDFADAKAACDKLSIPLHTANFVSEYWTEVFSPFIAKCERGLTPNPDLLCNRAIKFDALIKFAKGLGADFLATGHYAGLQTSLKGEVQLVRPADREKDQTYFLASVPGTALADAIFPLANLMKSEVRQIAASVGLHNALRRSSSGICFIGKRKFAEFQSQYFSPLPGEFVNVDDMQPAGTCENILALTQGQRARLGGASDRFFVVGKDLPKRLVYVAMAASHPALYNHSALLMEASWISGAPPDVLEQEGNIHLSYLARFRHNAMPCQISLTDPFEPSKYTRLLKEDMPVKGDNSFQAIFSVAARAITPRQEFVMYEGNTCLGSAPIWIPGISMHESFEAYKPIVEEMQAARVGSLPFSSHTQRRFSEPVC